MTLSAVQVNNPAALPKLGVLARFMRKQPAEIEVAYLISSELFRTLLQCRASALAHPFQIDARAFPLHPGHYGLGRARPAPPHDGRNGHNGNGTSYDLDDEFGRQVREDLLKALSLPSEAFEEQEGISAIAEELKRHIEGRRSLGVLGDIKQESESKLAEAVRKLREEHTGNDRALHLIDEARREISRIAPALKLLREPTLLDRLIREVETDGEETLALRLRRFRPQAERLN